MPATRILLLTLAAALLVPVHAAEAEEIAAALSAGQATEALKAADRALGKSPRDARLRLLRGNALAALGRGAEAIQVYTALTRDYPNLPEPYNNLAALYAQQGQLDRARTTLQMALQTNPAYATAHANLADVYAKLAAQAYEKALQRDVVERSQNAQPRQMATVNGSTKLALVQDLLSRNSPANANPPQVLATAPVPAKPLNPAAGAVSKPASSAASSKPIAAPATAVIAAPATAVIAAAKPVAPTTAASKPTAVVVSKPVDSATERQETEQQVRKSVLAWADAWADKRVSAYLASYARSFKPAGQSRADWEKQRRERINTAKQIVVKLDRLRIKLDEDRATVRFIQRYKSDKLDTSTGKTLILEKNNGRWLISEERVG